MKRVVTGQRKDCKSVFTKVGNPEHVVKTDGMVWSELWATFNDDVLPQDGSEEPTLGEKWKSVYPSPGDTRIRLVEMDPEINQDPSEIDPEEIAKLAKALPGMLEHMEPEDVGMHTTDSVDYGILISGRMGLELDDGEIVDLEPGDVVVQNGTRHKWHTYEKSRIICG